MPGTPIPEDQSQGIGNVHALHLLGAESEERFDRLTRLAQRLFDAPLALLSLVDSDQHWFRSRTGLGPQEIPPEWSFCAQASLREEVVIVPDTTEDERFRDHPLVVDLPEIRFYAGCPLRAPDGSAFGTLCIIDHEPRTVEEEDAELLKDLAAMVEQELKSLSLATMDELTGLTNRRGFEAIATQTIAMCRRVDRPATLLLFDLDDFKRVNDTRGHHAGDLVLRGFADQLGSTFRDSDVVARMGQLYQVWRGPRVCWRALS